MLGKTAPSPTLHARRVSSRVGSGHGRVLETNESPRCYNSAGLLAKRGSLRCTKQGVLMPKSDAIIAQVVSVKQFLALLPALDALEVTEQEAKLAASLMSLPSCNLSAVAALRWSRETAAARRKKRRSRAKKWSVAPASSRISAVAASAGASSSRSVVLPSTSSAGVLGRRDGLTPRRRSLFSAFAAPSLPSVGLRDDEKRLLVAASPVSAANPKQKKLLRFRWVSNELRRSVRDLLAVNAPFSNRGRWSAKGNSEQGQAHPSQTPNPNHETTEIPSPVAPVSIKLDWLQLTFKCAPLFEVETVERVKLMLGGEWVERSGMHGYRKGLSCGHVFIFWGGQTTIKAVKQGMGVHVQASGQGVSELEARGVSDWREWLGERLKEGATFPRLDFAFDVRDGSLTVDMMEQAARAGLVSSRFDHHEPVAPFDSRGNLTARGFNFGHRRNDTSVVFYDKSLEQRQREAKEKGKSDRVDVGAYQQQQEALEASWAASGASAASSVAPGAEPVAAASVEPVAGADETWTRCELRVRNAVALDVLQKLLAGGWGVLSGVLAATLDVKERGGGEQRCRWPSAAWWQAFLGSAEKAPVHLAGKVRTIQGGVAALVRQYLPLMVAANAVVDDFIPNLLELVYSVDARRLPDRYLSMMAAYQNVREVAVVASSSLPDSPRCSSVFLRGSVGAAG